MAKAAKKLAEVETKASKCKAALAAKRYEQSARRGALAASVQEARQEAYAESLRKGLESARRGQHAVESRQKRLDALVERTSSEVKHALDVVQARKAKEEEEAERKGAALAERLGAADMRRQDARESSITFAAKGAGRARNFAVARQEQVGRSPSYWHSRLNPLSSSALPPCCHCTRMFTALSSWLSRPVCRAHLFSSCLAPRCLPSESSPTTCVTNTHTRSYLNNYNALPFLQQQAFALQVKKAKLSSSLERAAEKRESTLKAIQDAAIFFNHHAAEVAEHVKRNSQSELGGGAAAGSATVGKASSRIFKRLVSAEVSRSLSLKARAEQSAASAAVLSARPALSSAIGHHPEVIHISVGGRAQLKGGAVAMPPPSLLKRLSVKSYKLLATAAARHLGAFTRREMIGTGWHQKRVRRIGRVAKAAAKRAQMRAELVSTLQARDARIGAMLACRDAAAKRKAARAKAMSTLFEANRLAIAEERALCGLTAAMRGEAAAERHGKELRTRAKRGVLAVRGGAANARRGAIQRKVHDKAACNALRCISAEDRRNALLETRAAMAAQLAGAPRSVHWSGVVCVE